MSAALLEALPEAWMCRGSGMLMGPVIQLETGNSVLDQKFSWRLYIPKLPGDIPRSIRIYFFFTSFRTTGSPKPDLGFPLEILSGAHSENAGHLSPASQVLLRVPFGQEKYKLLSKSKPDVSKLDYVELTEPLPGEKELWGEDGCGMECLCQVS